uniref:Uncharacterized protein n=1 Tax=Alexandrium andersonii TaxID=327968 RepID=A0A7S2CQ04_9DINO|mmetsp:Transcript_41779/g.94944  ORF Transcript_41779/g.94944 Transcript_41779/m.94944 type:complete len:153 (+) Transcript_41779:74-532(+)
MAAEGTSYAQMGEGGSYVGKPVFLWAAVYGLGLAALIASSYFNPFFIFLFVKGDAYTLGNFGMVWEMWHGVGCAFVGLMNLSVFMDPFGFGVAGRRAVSLNTAFIYTVWGVQNTYYCIFRADLFTLLMWLHAILCLLTGALSMLAWTKGKAA